MICNIIKRKLCKSSLDQQFKIKFIYALNTIKQNYQNDLHNKSIIIQKVCMKYLKIINHVMSGDNLNSTMNALQFVKGLQLDNYQGKSYQLYIIKVRLHLLIIRWLQMSIQYSTYQQQYIKYSDKKTLYIERLKLFIKQVQQSYFYDLFYKDYYSNLQLILFKILRQQFQKYLNLNHNNSMYITNQDTKKYILKIFQNLKSHILQLNQLLVYQEKKVYEIMAKKVQLMLQLYVIQSVVLFVEEVAQRFSQKQWDKYVAHVEMLKKQKKLKQTDYVKQSKNNISLNKINNFNINNNNSSINYINSSYSLYKQKYYNQKLQLIWQKYDIIFSKIPQNINKNQVFNKTKKIIDSFQQRQNKLNKQTQKTIRNIIIKYSNKISQKFDPDSSTQSVHIDQNQEQKFTSQIKQKNNQNTQLNVSGCSSKKTLIKRKKEKRNLDNKINQQRLGKYKQKINSELKDFMDFVNDNHQTKKDIHLNQIKQQDININNKDNRNSTQTMNICFSDTLKLQKINSQLIQEKNIQKNQIQSVKKSNLKQNIQQNINANEKQIKKLPLTVTLNNQNNNQNNQMKSMSLYQTKYQNQLQNKNKSISFYNAQGQGLRRLHAIKNSSINILKQKRQKQLQKLRQTKTADIINLKQNKNINSLNHAKNTTFYNQKQAQQKKRSKTISVNFNKQKQQDKLSNTNKQNYQNQLRNKSFSCFFSKPRNDLFSLPKLNTMKNSKLFLFTQGLPNKTIRNLKKSQNNHNQTLKIHYKKNTLKSFKLNTNKSKNQ